jgi:hypothetical protein
MDVPYTTHQFLDLSHLVHEFKVGVGLEFELIFHVLALIGDSAPNRPPVPIQIGHRFRLKSATDSEANRPAIPIQIGHPFKG